MKNIQLLETASDVYDFVLDTWKTDVFRQSHANGGHIHDIVTQFAKQPRLFCEASNDDLERSHFPTWFGASMQRHDYTNAVIADLYRYHEFIHAGTMPYWPGLGPDAFEEKMTRNELEASTASEIAIYFEMPGLREASFDHPIYADRYLADPAMQVLWANNKTVALETFRLMRRNVMIGKPDNELDITERWVRKFTEQNTQYFLIWRNRYDEVERHMFAFQQKVYRGDRKGAITFHADWLAAEMADDPTDAVPFRDEAQLFAQHYLHNRKLYNLAMQAETERLKQTA